MGSGHRDQAAHLRCALDVVHFSFPASEREARHRNRISDLQDQSIREVFAGFFEGDEGVTGGVGRAVDQAVGKARFGGGEARHGEHSESMTGDGYAGSVDERGEHLQGLVLGKEVVGLQGKVGFHECQVCYMNGSPGNQLFFQESGRTDVLKRWLLHEQAHEHRSVEMVEFNGRVHLREVLSFSVAACPQARDAASLISPES